MIPLHMHMACHCDVIKQSSYIAGSKGSEGPHNNHFCVLIAMEVYNVLEV